MNEPPGPLLGEGRAADVYDLGDGTVLRRYRNGQDTEPEAAAMRWLVEQGAVRLPEVVDAEGTDLVMERIDGPTMLEDLEQRPWRLIAHARMLAALQRSLNALVAPDWFPTRPGVAHGTAVLHLDLHPMNVILGDDGPVVIDWTNVSRGSPSTDAAMTYVLGAGYEVDGAQDRLGRWLLLSSFTRARGKRLVADGLQGAIELRLADPNTTPGERASLERLRR